MIFLFSRCGDGELSEMEQQTFETERADRSMFVQELLLSTLAEGLRLDDHPLDPSTFAPFNSQLDESDSHPHSPDPTVMNATDSGRPINAGHSGSPSPGAGSGAGAGAGGMSNAGAGAGAAGSGSLGSAGAATNSPIPRPDKREKPASTHRNMVKRLAESNKKLEKEPPPVMKPKLSQH